MLSGFPAGMWLISGRRRLRTRDGQFKRIALSVVREGTLRETQLQLQVFNLFKSQAPPGQAVSGILNRIFKANDVLVK